MHDAPLRSSRVQSCNSSAAVDPQGFSTQPRGVFKEAVFGVGLVGCCCGEMQDEAQKHDQIRKLFWIH